MKKAQIDIPNNITFVPINFNQDSLQNTLEKAGYKYDNKSLLKWEGVSYYLEVESIETILDHSR